MIVMRVLCRNNTVVIPSNNYMTYNNGNFSSTINQMPIVYLSALNALTTLMSYGGFYIAMQAVSPFACEAFCITMQPMIPLPSAGNAYCHVGSDTIAV